NHFDAVVSLHTIYHVAEHEQETAVRQLIRVAKPGTQIVIVYANPDRLWLRIRRWIGRRREGIDTAPLCYYVYPLNWWRRFINQSSVKILPWRSLAAQESALLPGKKLARLLLRLVLMGESLFPW